VISRASVLRYRGQVHEPQRVRRELAVRYVTGSVHRSGDKVRLSAELCDCEAARRSGPTASPAPPPISFELQDELSARVAATIAPQVQESELRRVCASIPRSLDAYECVLRGLDLLYRVEDDPWRQALPLFERAIALDPRYAAAYALAATCHGERFYEGTSSDPTADHMEAERLSRLALSFDRFDPLALSLCGHIRSWLFHDYDHAIELYDRAAANPSAAIAGALERHPRHIGETREARRRVEIGLRSAYDAHVFFSYGLVGLAAYAGGDYAEAASWGRRAMTLNPLRRQPALPRREPRGHGQFRRRTRSCALRGSTSFSAASSRPGMFKDAYKRRFGEHLVLAGLPE
jgi:adenylate cyclase